MNTAWSDKTSNPLEDIKEAIKAIRKPSKFKPTVIWFEGKQYTFSEFANLMESRKERS